MAKVSTEDGEHAATTLGGNTWSVAQDLFGTRAIHGCLHLLHSDTAFVFYGTTGTVGIRGGRLAGKLSTRVLKPTETNTQYLWMCCVIKGANAKGDLRRLVVEVAASSARNDALAVWV
jgi:hypothetical protein